MSVSTTQPAPSGDLFRAACQDLVPLAAKASPFPMRSPTRLRRRDGHGYREFESAWSGGLPRAW